jgi:hypothetical protein
MKFICNKNQDVPVEIIIILSKFRVPHKVRVIDNREIFIIEKKLYKNLEKYLLSIGFEKKNNQLIYMVT